LLRVLGLRTVKDMSTVAEIKAANTEPRHFAAKLKGDEEGDG
jgi:hypothetical protein